MPVSCGASKLVDSLELEAPKLLFYFYLFCRLVEKTRLLINANIEVPGDFWPASAFQNTQLTSDDGLGSGSLKPSKTLPPPPNTNRTPPHTPSRTGPEPHLGTTYDWACGGEIGSEIAIFSISWRTHRNFKRTGELSLHDFSQGYAKLLLT